MNNKRILIVEEEIVAARHLSDQLTALGHEPVGRTTTAEQALILAEQLRPDLALINVRLAGGLDGIAAAQTIRVRFSIPVVLLTAPIEPTLPDRAKTALPYGCLTKPFQLIELRMAIEAALNQPQAGMQKSGAPEEQTKEAPTPERDELEARVAARTEELQRVNEELRAEIAARKQAEEKLRELSQRLSYHVDHSPLAVIEWGPDMRLIRWSDEAERIFGWKAGEVLGKRMEDFRWIYLEDASQVSEVKTELLTGTNLRRFSTNRNYRKDGAIVHCEWYNSSLLDESGKLRSILSQVLDITERKRTEEALRVALIKYKTLFECFPQAITVSDAEGNILENNPLAVRLLGEPPAKRTPRGIDSPEWRIVRPDGTPMPAEEYASVRALKENRPVGNVEMGIVKSDNTITWINVTAVPLPLEGYGVAITYGDITERRRAEAEKAELEAQNRKLQKSASLGRMAGAIAHHFNNKLAAVMANLELAGEVMPRGEAAIEYLIQATQAARQAAEVSGSMLTYLGYKPGKHKLADLSSICEESLSLLRAAAPKNAVLETELPRPGPAINADANQMQQLLTNLVTNSWEAIGENRGTIRLTVKTVPAETIPITLRFPVDWQPHDRVYACLEVADTGCGIAVQDIEQLFDPFFTRKFMGRGLGLPVALGIARAHDGVITVASESGRGSVFRVFLPVSAEVVRHPSDRAAPSSAFKGQGTMLLVEDEDMLLKVAAKTLTRFGFTVLAAKDGVEALELFQRHRDTIRFVLSDLTMPRMNGWETLAALRQLSPNLPVILCSGYGEVQAASGAHAEQPQAFLNKPYEHEKLIEAINQALAKVKE